MVFVNLVDHLGRESELGAQFERHVRLSHHEKLDKYISFDFHEKCKKNPTNLTELLELCKPFLKKFK